MTQALGHSIRLIFCGYFGRWVTCFRMGRHGAQVTETVVLILLKAVSLGGKEVPEWVPTHLSLGGGGGGGDKLPLFFQK